MRLLLISILFLVFTVSVSAQTSDCLRDFDFLVQKINVDYPGYSEKVTPKTKQELNLLETKIRAKIQAHPDSCGKYLKEYAAWFRDNHLRVRRIQSASVSASETAQGPEILQLGREKVKKIHSDTSSIEGTWHSFGGDIFIFRDSDSLSFTAVSVSYNGTLKNQVLYRLSPSDKTEFRLIAYHDYNEYRPEPGFASLKLHNQVLEIHDETRFVRKSSSSVADDALLYSYLPEFPNGSNTYPLGLALTDSTFYLRLPSFMNDEANILTKKHWNEIISRPNLIIDIRNNGGGLDENFRLLTDLIYDKPYESKGVEWYATENNIRLFEESLKKGEIRNGEEGIKWTNALLGEMKKHVGGFVIHPLMGSDATITKDTVYPNPKRVGIIINEGNASSAEQFLLEAKNSSKTILFGNCNTAGVLDYSNAVGENLPSDSYELIFPMTRSRRLPDHPVDNIGIAPDVMIPYPPTEQLFSRLDQWVYYVKCYLELLK